MQATQYVQLPINEIVQGDCRKVLENLPDESIDMVMFSPPYYGLRNYGKEAETVWGAVEGCNHEWMDLAPVRTHGYDSKHAKNVSWPQLYGKMCIKCNAWKGQLGLESTWQMYIQHLIEICRAIKRVLKKTGSMYIVIGDTYSSVYGKHGNRTAGFSEKNMVTDDMKPPRPKDIPSKCLMGIPWRLAFALIDDGWILRNSIIWYKINHMPSSVKDRLTNTYENIFFFVKSRKYYYNLDAIREQHTSIKDLGRKRTDPANSKYYGIRPSGYLGQHPLGKNPGDFWPTTTKPFKGEHFAVYPPDICVRPILASCPPDGIVLDPMCGSGTTCLVAKVLGRKWLGIEVNPKYVEIATRRVKDAPFPIAPITNVAEAKEALKNARRPK